MNGSFVGVVFSVYPKYYPNKLLGGADISSKPRGVPYFCAIRSLLEAARVDCYYRTWLSLYGVLKDWKSEAAALPDFFILLSKGFSLLVFMSCTSCLSSGVDFFFLLCVE